MIIEEIKNIKSGKTDLRKFGLTVGIALALLGLLVLWRGKGYYLYLFIPSAALLLFGLIAPGVLKPVQKAWMTLAVLLGWCMTRVILGILFYLVVTPIGILTRLLGKDFLHLKADADAGSYWTPKINKPSEKSDYEKQF